MSVIHLDVRVSSSDLLQAVDQLETTELAQFVEGVLVLKARRLAPVLSPQETELLQKISRGLSADEQQRYLKLIRRRQEETITETELTELLALSDKVEAMNAERMAALAELAQLNQVPLPQLMADLDIEPPGYV